MASSDLVALLRPCLSAAAASSPSALRRVPRRRSAPTRALSAGHAPRRAPKASTAPPAPDATHDVEQRVAQLRALAPLSECYPRLPAGFTAQHVAPAAFHAAFGMLRPRETLTARPVTVAGRVTAVRRSGASLVFLDLRQDGHGVQVVCDRRALAGSVADVDADADADADAFRRRTALIRRGDVYAATGFPTRTPSGELSLAARGLPRLLAPSLHQIPETLDDAETRARRRHVDMLVNPAATHTLRLADLVDDALAGFLRRDGFTRVHTPILSAGAGGAVARPFATEASELAGQALHLRVAPELWLKRLVVGGLDRVFEIGPAFRNEGVDQTHNPEFRICEFYQAFATLDSLIAKTERLLASIATAVATAHASRFPSLSVPSPALFRPPYPRLEFLPTLERQLGHPLPDLDQPTAAAQLLEIFARDGLTPPRHPTLPRLLDALATHHLEPLCDAGIPTFITHHPASLSPLAKHLRCPTTGRHTVAARAELFVASRELANMYEEENDPAEQRRKFTDQLAFRARDGEGDGRSTVDEDYLQTLEWGLPPTGGWGCGVDRLVMLFGGRERLADVLPFGSLRNVVAMGGRKGSGGGVKE